MTHIVILGAGIAGVTAAYALRDRLGPRDEVTVVSDKTCFHFVPSNPSVALGWRDRADVGFPIAPYLAARGIKFVHSAVKGLQADVMQVDLENGDVLFYDYLLIATGTADRSDEIPGLAEHAHSLAHAEQAERALEAYREFVRQPGPVVIGAAPGASVLAPLYEYALLLDADLKRRRIRDQVAITIVTPEPWPGHLGLGGPEAARGAMTAALVDTRIGAICNARTVRVGPGTIAVVELDASGHERRNHSLPYAYSVYWAAPGGVQGVRRASGLVDEHGLVVVDEYLRSPSHSNVLAVGACVAQAPAGATPVPMGTPDSVYGITRAVETAVGNILAMIGDASLTSHIPEGAKWLREMGTCGTAYLSEPQVPLRDINWLRQGRWVHQAKIDFEKYFLDRIRLRPGMPGAFPASRLAGVMDRLRTAVDGRRAPPPAEGSSGPPEIRLSGDAGMELRALARSLGQAPGALATELLAAAVHEARAYLDEPTATAIARSRRELLVADLPERQPGVTFLGDGV